MTWVNADILLAEDNPSDAELLAGCLATIVDPRRIHRVHDGVEALDFLFCREAYATRDAGTPVRLVLLDIKLPRVDGFEVLARLREDERRSSVPVVMFTSSNVERDVAEAYRLRANGYVQKPVDFDRFRGVVQSLGQYWLSINEPPPDGGARGAS